MSRRHRRSLLFGFAFALLAAAADAEVILSNLPGTRSGEGSHLGLGHDGVTRAQAVGITTALPTVIHLMTVLISNLDKAPSELTGALHADAEGSPGARLASFPPLVVPPVTDAELLNLRKLGGINLAPTTTYWFVLEGPSTPNLLLWETLTPNTPPVATGGAQLVGYRSSDDGGATWTESTSYNGVRIRVFGEIFRDGFESGDTSGW
jgi:hypothetical protein